MMKQQQHIHAAALTMYAFLYTQNHRVCTCSVPNRLTQQNSMTQQQGIPAAALTVCKSHVLTPAPYVCTCCSQQAEAAEDDDTAAGHTCCSFHCVCVLL
jgi:hypothetical protein